MLVDDWREWRNNLRRWSILGAVNAALLLALGPSIFSNWLGALTSFGGSPYIWVGNLSIRSFATLVFHYLSEYGWVWVNPYLGLAQFMLLALVLACLFLIVFRAYRQGRRGLNPHLLLACTIASLLIPSVSHDCKLSFLAGPVALFYMGGGFPETDSRHRLRTIVIGLALVFSAAYSSTLFSYANKPHVLQHNLPALMLMLLVTTSLAMLDSVREKSRAVRPRLTRGTGNAAVAEVPAKR
jgi:hypothetical protein